MRHKPFIRNIVYVPAYKPPEEEDFQKLREFALKHKKLLILTGAGISTESGKIVLLFKTLIQSVLLIMFI